MIRLLTPLVLSTVLVVCALAIARLLLMPSSWLSSLVALLFFPVVIVALVARARATRPAEAPIKAPGHLRAALVGAGVALATALVISMADVLGIALPFNDGTSKAVLILLPAILGIVVDLIGARLEKKAAQEGEDDSD